MTEKPFTTTFSPAWFTPERVAQATSVPAESVIRMVPPLILTTAEADDIVALLTPLVKDLLAE